MRQFQPALGIALVVVLTVVSGIIHGRIRYRWGPPEEIQNVGKKLTQFPKKFGDWECESEEEMDRTAVQMLECTDYFSRKYNKTQTGDRVDMAVILGPAGPIAVHTPEVCYSSRAFTIQEKRHRVAINREDAGDKDGPDDEFWTLTFRSNDVAGRPLATYYAWSTGGRWVASGEARYEFAGFPYLYKIQLASFPNQSDLEAGIDPCRKFLKDFVPVMEDYLVEPSESGDQAE